MKLLIVLSLLLSLNCYATTAEIITERNDQVLRNTCLQDFYSYVGNAIYRAAAKGECTALIEQQECLTPQQTTKFTSVISRLGYKLEYDKTNAQQIIITFCKGEANGKSN